MRRREFVDQPQALSDLVEQLQSESTLAVDTEADSLHSFREKLCLIQISNSERDWVVDPLVGLDLTELFAVFQKRRVILHGADFDLRMLMRSGMGCPEMVFDTMLAARLVGLRQFSLAALVQNFCAVEMQKGEQKADWGRRPLSPKMLEYAYNDTAYLPEIVGQLEADLVKLGRLDWLQQCVSRVIELVYKASSNGDEEPWRISGSGHLKGLSAAAVRHLWEWRNRCADQIDKPAFHVARNDLLIENARRVGESESPLEQGIHPRFKRSFLQAIEEAKAIPLEQWPRKPKSNRQRPSPEMETRLNQLRDQRQKVAVELDLEVGLIASRVILEKIAMDPSLAESSLMPWQYELLGPALERL